MGEGREAVKHIADFSFCFGDFLQGEYIGYERFYDLGPYASEREFILAQMDKELAYWRTTGETANGPWSSNPHMRSGSDISIVFPTKTAWLNHLVESKAALLTGHKFRSTEDQLNGSFVLSHSDIQAGNNTLRRGHKLVGVIDWEFASYLPLSCAIANLTGAELRDLQRDIRKRNPRIEGALDTIDLDATLMRAEERPFSWGPRVVDFQLGVPHDHGEWQRAFRHARWTCTGRLP